ncbi:MAG: threonine ammonia-lyase [Gemmatimonadota bacterium]
MSDERVGLNEIRDAAAAIEGHLHRTPVTTSAWIGATAGCRVFLKLELFQKTGSFKPRGVINTLRQLSADERRRGVISLSAGNHAQALAWGASLFEMHSVVVMPETALAAKVNATRDYGAEVVLTGEDLLAAALRIRDERDLVLVHPFDDQRVIAGQGTVGLELLEDAPDLDLVLVACGGGGLLGGVAAAVKSLSPRTMVIGVEPERAAAMSRSLAAGSPQRLETWKTVADGLAAPFAGQHTLRHVQAFVDDVILVSEDEIISGTRALMERCKLFAEPAAGAAVAPLLSGRLSLRPTDNAAVIVCGGNADPASLASLFALRQ